jgi:hypothetical protein
MGRGEKHSFTRKRHLSSSSSPFGSAAVFIESKNVVQASLGVVNRRRKIRFDKLSRNFPCFAKILQALFGNLLSFYCNLFLRQRFAALIPGDHGEHGKRKSCQTCLTPLTLVLLQRRALVLRQNC